MDEAKSFRVLIEILKERMPEDCAELLEENYRRLLNEIKRKGMDVVIKEWIGEDEEVILL